MEDYSKYSDAELAALLRAGEETAFKEIYERYHALLFAFAFRKLRDKEESRDLVQEIFINLWESRERFVLKTYLSGYLYKSVLNKVLDIWKHNKIVRAHAELHQFTIDVNSVETDYLIREKDIAAMIEKEIMAMPPKMRQVYELKYRQYLSTRDIASQLGISEHTVSTQLKRASVHLKDKLGVMIYIIYILNQ